MYGDSCVRTSSTPLAGKEGFDMLGRSQRVWEDRFSSLETRSALNQTEIGMLRESVEGMTSWRASVDTALGQTLQYLDEDIGTLKTTIGDSKVNGNQSSGTIKEKLNSYAVELGHLKALQSVQGQLDTVEARLQETERILVDTSVFEEVLTEVKNEISEVEILAGSAVSGVSQIGADVGQLVDTVETLQGSLHDVDCKVETIRLALDVVEQSLDDFNDSEVVESIRLRMDDLDVGIENVARDSESRIQRLSERVEALKEELHASTKVSNDAFDLAQSAQLEVSEMKHMYEHRLATAPSSGASTPSSVSVRSSDARVKAAVHTLSDGYRSLHKAMGLMYDEHAELSQRITRAGLDAHERPPEMSLMEKIRADDAIFKLRSFPIDAALLHDSHDEKYRDENDDLRVLLAAQLKDSRRAEERIESLEDEVRQLRQILKSFICRSSSTDATSPPVRLNMIWSPSENTYKVALECSD